MVPLREFILKLASRCNLACDYCYVYAMADQGWRRQPRVMSPATIDRTAERIAEHVYRHGLRRVTLILHGGEPLLAGSGAVGHAAGAVRAAVPAGVVVDVRLQTNGALLDEPVLAVLRSHGIRIGVSLDGAAAHHDRHRVRIDGRGSHAETARGLRLLCQPANRHLFAGLICVIDVANDPVSVYESLLEFAPPALDFLLPHGNWSDPPPGRVPGAGDTPYARWLIAAFDRWYGAARQETAVRLFQEVINLVLGGRSRSEQVGLSPVAFVVVDTDGALQQADALKSAAAGAADTGLNVFDDSFDDVLTNPRVIERQAGVAALADGCQRCRLVRVCGGGHYAHRYRRGSGFDNPSVYCPDLQRFISHVAGRVRADVRTAR